MSSPDDIEPSPADRDLALSLVCDDPPFGLLRRVGLVPARGLGLGRRAVFFALVAWLPIAIWALVAGRALPGAAGEPLFEHFGVHVRCLIAIPILILAQGLAHSTTTRLLPWFVHSGVIPENKAPQFRAVVEGIARLRNSTGPWLVIGGLVIAWSATGPIAKHVDELNWAMDPTTSPPQFGFGGWWFLYVARPIYIALVLAWIWRVVLLTLLFLRTSKLGLELVPTHPDHVGGLGFVEGFAKAFGPVVFVLSAVLASHWAHEVLYHDVQVQSLRIPAAAFLVVLLLVFLAPLLAFIPALRAAKKRATLEYAALVGKHGDLVRRRWILGEQIADDELLHAPEIGPVADTVSLYQAVKSMRIAPLGKSGLIAIALPAALPLLLVFAIRVPIQEILMKLLHAVA